MTTSIAIDSVDTKRPLKLSQEHSDLNNINTNTITNTTNNNNNNTIGSSVAAIHKKLNMATTNNNNKPIHNNITNTTSNSNNNIKNTEIITKSNNKGSGSGGGRSNYTDVSNVSGKSFYHKMEFLDSLLDEIDDSVSFN